MSRLRGFGERVAEAVVYVGGDEMEAVEKTCGARLDVIVEVEDDARFLLPRGHADGMRRRWLVSGGGRGIPRLERHHGGIFVGGPLLASSVAQLIGKRERRDAPVGAAVLDAHGKVVGLARGRWVLAGRDAESRKRHFFLLRVRQPDDLHSKRYFARAAGLRRGCWLCLRTSGGRAQHESQQRERCTAQRS